MLMSNWKLPVTLLFLLVTDLPSDGQVPAQVTAKPALKAGSVIENPKDGLKYVWIPPGTFRMGCSVGDTECYPAETPAIQVTIRSGFWIGQTEVTVGAYKRFTAGAGKHMPAIPSSNKDWANDKMPIVNVSWDEAQAYCKRSGGHLPSEPQWEFAARGGEQDSPRWTARRGGVVRGQ